LRTFSLDDMAILVRASHQMRAFEDRFLTIGLPYRVIGGPRFYERQEIRDAMAYFRLAVSPEDDLAFERIVNTPKRGLGDKAQADIQRAARAVGAAAGGRAMLVLAQGGHRRPGGGAVARLCRRDRPLARSRCADGYEPYRLAEMILDESGYTAMWQADKTPEAPGRLENLKELVKALEQFENLQGFWNTSPDHGQRDRGGGGKGVHHDAARRQGAGVSGGVPAGLGGRAVPQPAQHGRKRASRGWRRNGAWPMSASPGPRSCAPFPSRPTAGSMASGKASCPAASSTNCPPIMSRC
jgi:hypothetical protein